MSNIYKYILDNSEKERKNNNKKYIEIWLKKISKEIIVYIANMATNIMNHINSSNKNDNEFIRNSKIMIILSVILDNKWETYIDNSIYNNEVDNENEDIIVNLKDLYKSNE